MLPMPVIVIWPLYEPKITQLSDTYAPENETCVVSDTRVGDMVIVLYTNISHSWYL